MWLWTKRFSMAQDKIGAGTFRAGNAEFSAGQSFSSAYVLHVSNICRTQDLPWVGLMLAYARFTR
jgi:hypothetical protein